MTRPYTLIRDGLVLDIPRRASGPADILIAGDTIREIGPPGMAAPADAAVIDARDRLIIPGFVNAHTHGNGSFSKGLGDRWSLELLLTTVPVMAGCFTVDDKRTAALLNAAEMVRKGSTACYDMYFEAPTATVEGMGAVADAYAEVGVRVALAPMMADTTFYRAIPGLLDAIPEPHRTTAEAMRASAHTVHLAACADIARSWTLDRTQARLALGPTIPHHCSDAFLTGCRDLAREFDLGIQMHLAESKVQAVTGITRYGRTLTAHLDALGLLGPTFTGAHGIWLTDTDIARLADTGSAIAHNPGSNLRLGTGVARARALRSAGVPFGIGTDGSASSDHQNMLEAVRMAAVASRVTTPDPDGWLGTWEVLEAATQGGAKAMGMERDIGAIAPGYKADLVFLDLADVAFVPLNDAANQIVNCADSSAIDNVMIGGRMVLEGRRFTTLDYPSLRRKAAAATERLLALSQEAQARAEALAPFVSAHCVGLTCQHYPVRRTLYG